MEHKYDCRKFSGYRPCKPGKVCRDCREYDPIAKRILLVNLDALGDVLRTTAILKPIRAKYKRCFIVWLTDKSALPLLENNPLIDRIYPYSFENISALQCERFDVLMNVDKSRRSAALANLISAGEKFGFGLTPEGAICPLNKEAEYLYNLGLDDEEKFGKNKKTEQQLLTEALGLEYKRDEYVLSLRDAEKAFVEDYKRNLGLRQDDILAGFNTGCSDFYPYKKMAFDKQVLLIETLLDSVDGIKIALLGGREDTENNARLTDHFKENVISTPTDWGLRKGILFIDACDLVISGDTLGMHIAIALRRPVVAWFSITCENEIDLYGRGAKVASSVKCRPCWKTNCSNIPKCNEVIDISKICDSVKSLIRKRQTVK